MRPFAIAPMRWACWNISKSRSPRSVCWRPSPRPSAPISRGLRRRRDRVGRTTYVEIRTVPPRPDARLSWWISGSTVVDGDAPMSATLAISDAHIGSQPQRGESLSALDRIGKAMSLVRGETLFYEGDAALYCFKVISGALRSCRVLADGRRHIAEFFLPGDFIALSAENAHRFTAEAVTETKLMRYPRHSVEQMTEAQPRLSRCLLDLLCRSLSAAQQQMLLLGRKNAVERMASFLLMMAERA